MEKKRNYYSYGSNPSEEYLRKKKNDNHDIYFPPEELEPPHY